MNRILFILILGIMLIFAGCIESGSKSEKEITPVTPDNETLTNQTNLTNEPETAKVCAETNGIVTYGNESYPSKCLSKSTLEKVLCKSNAPSKENISCQSGYECYGGSCQPASTGCVDSDGGENLNVTGTVTYMGATYTDYCEVGNLHEYYCNNGKLDGIITYCPKASYCLAGQCLYWPPTCKENGTFIKVDKHTGLILTFSDYCNDSEVLVHYYCEANINQSTFIYAKSNETCNNSTKTFVSRECTDSDGGAIKDVAGIAKYGPDEYPDKCVASETAVKEYFCEDGLVESVVLECKNGCVNNVLGDIFGTYVGYCS